VPPGPYGPNGPMQPGPYQGQGWSGSPQPPGYPPAPPPGRPRRRTGLVVGIIVGGIVLVLIGVAAIFVVPRLTKTVGAAAYEGDVPSECRTSAAVMTKIGTPNIAPPNVDDGGTGIHRVSCGWRPAESEQTKFRSTTVTFNTYTSDYPIDPGDAARESFETYPGQPIDGIGDAAMITEDSDRSSAFRSADVRVIKGTTVIAVGYSGWDTALFGNQPMPDGSAAAAAQAVARELAANIS
jgi:hypothetical protein